MILVLDAPQSMVKVCQLREPDMQYVKKVDFVAFIATVINCTAQVATKSKKLDIIVAAVGKYLRLQEFTAEDLQGLLATEDVTPSQAPV